MKKISTLLLLAFICWFNKAGAQSFSPTLRLVFEDQTQCSTGFSIWCPRGIVMIDSFVNGLFGNTVEIISVHSNTYGPPYDLMTDSVYAVGVANSPYVLANSWPSVTINRELNTDPDSIFFYYNQHAGDAAMADVGLNLTYDTSTRQLAVTASAHFAATAIHYSLALALTEDSVHGTDSDYTQRNTYAAGANGPMACTTSLDFAAQPDPVPAELMYYRHVARAILPSYTGAVGSLPDTARADSIYSYTFAPYTVPANYDASKMRAIVLLLDMDNGQINNANGANIPILSTGMHPLADIATTFNVFPNPFSGMLHGKFTLSGQQQVYIEVCDNLGQHISRQDLGLMPAGEHSFQLNGNNLASGMYYLSLKDDDGAITKKIVVER